LVGGYKSKQKTVLSKNDKTESHNTQKEIAKDLGWSTGKVAQADVVDKKADVEQKEKLRRNEVSIHEVYKKIKKRIEIAEENSQKTFDIYIVI
jgi:hypothetical protein